MVTAEACGGVGGRSARIEARRDRNLKTLVTAGVQPCRVTGHSVTKGPAVQPSVKFRWAAVSPGAPWKLQSTAAGAA